LPKIWRPETYGYWVPGVGVAFSIIMLIIVGAFVANLFGRTIIAFGEHMVGRMPVVRGVYRALKQIFETVLSQSHTSFQKVGVIEYPRRGLYSMVFVSTTTTGEINHKCCEQGESMLSVFLPTTPNPTSGYLLFVPASDVIILDMKVEDAAKMVISAGLVVPEYPPGGDEAPAAGHGEQGKPVNMAKTGDVSKVEALPIVNAAIAVDAATDASSGAVSANAARSVGTDESADAKSGETGKKSRRKKRFRRRPRRKSGKSGNGGRQ
jgi:uncharacterized membrane protein